MAARTQEIIFGTLTAITGALGIPGNVLVLAVYLPRCQRGSSQVLVVWMAVLDLWCSLFVSLPQSYQLLTSIEVEPLCRVKNFLLVASSFVTFQVTAVIAVDRYLAICHPHKKVMTVRRAHVIIAANVVVGVLVSIPTFLFFQVIDIGEDPSTKICTIVRRFVPGLKILGFARVAAFLALAIVIIVLYTRIAFVVRKRPKVCPSGVRPSQQSPTERLTTKTNMTKVAAAAAAVNVASDDSSPPGISGSQMKMPSAQIDGEGFLLKAAPRPSTSGSVSKNTPKITSKESDLDTDCSLHKATAKSLLVPDERSVNETPEGTDHPSFKNSSCVTVSRHSEAPRIGNQGLAKPSQGPVGAKPTGKKQETYADRVRNKTSRMLLVIAIIVVISYAPQILVIVFGSRSGRKGGNSALMRDLMVHLTSFVALFNSALNPLIYTFLNSKFPH